MAIEQYLQSFKDSLQSSANVKTIFGEPVKAEGKTIIPVARIAYGFGGGLGTAMKSEQTARNAEGGGGGGGVVALPVGVVEVSAQTTRFIGIGQKRQLAAAAAFGMLMGMLFRRVRK